MRSKLSVFFFLLPSLALAQLDNDDVKIGMTYDEVLTFVKSRVKYGIQQGKNAIEWRDNTKYPREITKYYHFDNGVCDSIAFWKMYNIEEEELNQFVNQESSPQSNRNYSARLSVIANGGRKYYRVLFTKR